MRRYDTTAPAAPVQERKQPYRPPTRESDVFVPIQQAATIGALVATILILIALAFQASWPIDGFALIWALAFGIVTLATYVWRMNVMDRTIMVLEKWTGKDLPGGPPEAPVPYNPDQAREKAARAADANRQADAASELVKFVDVCSSLGTSEKDLGVPPSPQARKVYCERRDALIKIGVGRWRDERNHKKGWDLVVRPEEAEPIIRKHIVQGER